MATSFVLGLLAAFLLAAVPATAYTVLSSHQRRQILRSADLPAPNGRVLRDPSCIAGRLSTVDRRWAAVNLTDTPSCVRRYEGASGEAVLLKRSSVDSHRWQAVGSIGDNCVDREAGASDRVLRDLGCGAFSSALRQAAAPSRHLLRGVPRVTPRGVGPLHLGATIKLLHRRGEIGEVRGGCEVDPGQRVAPLRSPLAGWAVFADGGRRLTSILITAGAQTAAGIGIGSTPQEARAAYPSALYKPPGSFVPFAEGFFWVNGIAHPKLTFIIDPQSNLIREIDVPNPNFCE